MWRVAVVGVVLEQDIHCTSLCYSHYYLSYLNFLYDVKFVTENGKERKEIDLRDLQMSNLRELIGYVGQEPVLIGKTLREVLLADDLTD